MYRLVIAPFNRLRLGLGFTGRKVLVLAALGILLGVALAFVIPLRVF